MLTVSVNKIYFPEIQMIMRKMFFNIMLLFFCFCLMKAQAQSEFCTDLKKNTVFFEVGGNGVLYSLNYDRLFDISRKFKASTRIGLHFSENLNDNGNRYIGFPLEVSGLYSIFNNKHFLELGTGLTLMNDNDFSLNHKTTLFILAFRAGYRYQKPQGGMFFKIGFTPLYDFYIINPKDHIIYSTWFLFGGIGIGYTF